jgi:hypothetical protein
MHLSTLSDLPMLRPSHSPLILLLVECSIRSKNYDSLITKLSPVPPPSQTQIFVGLVYIVIMWVGGKLSNGWKDLEEG